MNYAKEVKQLHSLARRGILTLIPKGLKDPLFLKNWRPLTMLSTDYKILAKILSQRVKTKLPHIIAPSQSGFMENRQIFNTLNISLGIGKYNKNIQGYILSLDFEKCFDRIEYNAIRGLLQYFNFGENFIKWTNLLLNNFTSCTMNNGYASDYFKVTRSCHQGCPLAPTLYLLCGEVLAHKIKENSGIKGITVKDLETVIAQFADDTQLFLENRESVEKSIATLALMESNIGLKVNYEKTFVYKVGDVPTFECSQSMVWDPGKLVILGIDLVTLAMDQYQQVLEQAQNTINTWYYKQLTLSGKVVIVNTLILSLFVYKLSST